jgi:L-ascorbate metabolism protein UlaG (beta-lactamase superfamily)
MRDRGFGRIFEPMRGQAHPFNMSELVAEPQDTFGLDEHFRDGRFLNPGVPDHGFWTAMKWMRTRKPGSWRGWIPSQPGPRPPARVEGSALRVTFINHATVLLQTAGLNILTDPVWSKHVSPVSFMGPARHRAPGIRFEDLPPIDCLLMSHNHYDHLDLPTLRRIAASQQPVVFCPLGVAKMLRGAGFKAVHELDWGKTQAWSGLEVACVPAQHFSARTPFDRNRTLWCGWVLQASSGNIYFAGDTGFGPFFSAIRDRFGPMRLALLPIGAYDPEWFMGPVHMTPEQAIEVRSMVDAAVAVPIHFGTFSLADDGETDPVDRLKRGLAGRDDADRFWLLQEGEGRLIP